MLQIRPNDAGRTVDLPVGEIAELRLAEKPGTGFRWRVEETGFRFCLVAADFV